MSKTTQKTKIASLSVSDWVMECNFEQADSDLV